MIQSRATNAPRHDSFQCYRFAGGALLLLSFLLLVGNVSEAQVGSVTLSASPGSRTVIQGQSATYVINLSRFSYPQNVNLSVNGLPQRTTYAFNPNSVSGNSSSLTITTMNTTPQGIYKLTVLDKGSARVHGVIITLTVNLAPPSVTLSSTPEQSDDYGVPVNDLQDQHQPR